jgi:hypothetical protein
VGVKGDEWAKEHVRQNATAEQWRQIQEDVEAGDVVPRGHVAGVVQILHALPPDCVGERDWSLADCGMPKRSEWAIGPHCLVLGDFKRLREPIAAKGQLGNWPLTDDAKAQLARVVNTPLETGKREGFEYPANPEALERHKEEWRKAKRQFKRDREADRKYPR